ncbi:hypothetical protein P245_19595 [Comamonas thiooxydans]|uniref:Uncharacterized protein n=1 Tax=Comamonas thiooxydans TaxID=363952 RepID=A0A0E3BBB4_9BURK|nr:hypothetical protein [Comamonas thiooxydans]KGG87658.1 hypothetical protein P245_19595 [Comamonas thiooxydans]
MQRDLLILLAPFSPILLTGIVGLVVYTPLSVPLRYVFNKEFLLGFAEFLAANAAFTALLILMTGQDLEIRYMPTLKKVQFAFTFALCYLIAYNLGKLRSNSKAKTQTHSTQESEVQE